VLKESGGSVDQAITYGYDTASGRLSSIAATQGASNLTFSYGYEPNSYSLIKTVSSAVHSATNT